MAPSASGASASSGAWASGCLTPARCCLQVGGGERRYHVVITAQGSAVHWQSRVHYYWYLRVRAECQAQHGSDCQMGGFTRVLHSGQPDDLMGEIPTHVVQPLEHSDNKGCVWVLVEGEINALKCGESLVRHGLPCCCTGTWC